MSCVQYVEQREEGGADLQLTDISQQVYNWLSEAMKLGTFDFIKYN